MRTSIVMASLVVATVGLGVPHTATAQLDDVLMRTEKIYGGMRLLAPSMVNAQASILEAMNFKTLADEERAKAEQLGKLGEKADKKGAEQISELLVSKNSESVKAALESKAGVTETLSAAQKTMLVAGAVEYLKGVAATVVIASEVPGLLSAVSSIQVPKNPMQAGKFLGAIAAAKTLGESIPKTVSLNVATAKALVAYLKVNKIDVPGAPMDFGPAGN